LMVRSSSRRSFNVGLVKGEGSRSIQRAGGQCQPLSRQGAGRDRVGRARTSLCRSRKAAHCWTAFCFRNCGYTLHYVTYKVNALPLLGLRHRALHSGRRFSSPTCDKPRPVLPRALPNCPLLPEGERRRYLQHGHLLRHRRDGDLLRRHPPHLCRPRLPSMRRPRHQ
jgi:hypothetical protein